jgi:chromosome segregation ATPase
MGMPTPPRPSRKEFTGRDTYNNTSDRAYGSPYANRMPFEEDRNESNSSYQEDFIGTARDYVSRMRDTRDVMPRSEPRRTVARSMSEYEEPRYSTNTPPSSHHERFSPHRESPRPAHDSYPMDDALPSKYEIMGMKEQLKRMEALENAISEKVAVETRLREEMSELAAQKSAEMERLHKKYSEEAVEQRSQLVETFKADMMEMKSEWENAFTRLKEEAEGTKRALMQELENANDAKVDLETRLGGVTAEYKSRLEEEKERCLERVREVKQAKEEDLERLRGMYEEHLEGLKSKQEDEKEGLKDEIQILLEENEKLKVCYENLEEEMERGKKELHELNLRCQASISDNVNYEKEVSHLKDEVDELLDENDKLKRSVHEIQEEVKDVKMEKDRVSKENARTHSELTRVNRELDEAEQDKNSLNRDYKDLLKKMEALEEERELETRYTEALVKQRDNMNDIIENCQGEIEELKASQADYDSLKAEFGNTADELDKVRGELKKMEGMKDELAAVSSKADSLQRERERYNATVKALKVDLRALHRENAGVETSLQEHMRILNEKWQDNALKLEKISTLEEELTRSMRLLEDQESERDITSKEFESKLERLTDELERTQSDLTKVSLLQYYHKEDQQICLKTSTHDAFVSSFQAERIKMELNDKISDYEAADAKHRRITEELQDTISRLGDKVAYLENEKAQYDGQKMEMRNMQTEMEKTRARRAEIENELEKAEDIKKGLKNKLEAAYYELEEAQREMSALKTDHEEELRAMNDLEDEVKMLRTKNAALVESADYQEQELDSTKEELNRLKKEQATIIEQSQSEVAESYKVKLRHLEEKHADQDRRFEEAIEKRFEQEMEKLQAKNRKLESLIRDQKEAIDEKNMTEMKRRGEFAKLRQELEIARSKERHLETHVGQLEEHISKIVSDYESRLQGSGSSISSNSNDERYKRQIQELEKKLEVSGAAMKQLGKSSLLMEKENERLKHDKNELKQKLKKLVDCTEKFSR